MRKHLSKVSLVVLPMFMVGMMFACNPEQVNTAKNVMVQAEFYVDMAEALVQVAAAQYADAPKVQVALQATVIALGVVKKSMAAATSGLDKDYAAVKAAIVTLVVEVFALSRAIKDAQALKAASN